MKFFKVGILFAIIGLLLAGCLAGYRNLIYNPQNITKEQVVKEVIHNALETTVSEVLDTQEPITKTISIENIIKNLKTHFEQVVTQLVQKAAKNWGKNNAATASQEVYVKYTDSYLSKAEVDFSKGIISVATLDTKDPKKALHKAIVATLLTPEDPEKVDLYSDKEITYSGKPYLANLVKDN